MKKKKVLDTLDKLIDRSERWMEDADKREDCNDMSFYKGQKEMALQIKVIVEKS